MILSTSFAIWCLVQLPPTAPLLGDGGVQVELGDPWMLGRVLVVNDGGGGDFLGLQEAVDAARDGDVLLLQSGTYAGFRLQAKGLTIVGEADATLRFRPPLEIEVSGLAAGQAVVLRSLRIRPGERAPHLVLREARGPILVEDLELEAPGEDVDAVLVEDCDAVTFARCPLIGGDSRRKDSHGLSVIRSNVFVFGETVSTGIQWGTDPSCVPRSGASGMRVEDGALFLSGVTVVGGGVPDCVFSVGDGGPGLELVRSTAEALGVVLTGGKGSIGGLFCGPGSAQGPPLSADATSSFTSLSGATHRTFLYPPVAREGTTLKGQLMGRIGEQGFLLTASRLGLPMSTPPLLVPWMLSGPLTLLPVGTLQTTYMSQYATVGELPRGIEAASFLAQGAFLDPSGTACLGNAAACVLLDRGFSPILDDCNGNGQDDVLDLVAGIALDCDLSGIPDGCELASGASEDCNANGTPDACETLAGEVHTFRPPAAGAVGFGGSVAIEGDLAVDPVTDRLLVFERSPGGPWPVVPSAEALPTLSSSGFSGFGTSVDLRSGLVAVGADFGGSGAGAVHLFEDRGGVWQETGILMPAAPSTAERFGNALAIDASGETIVVGAPDAAFGGAAYVFRRKADGSWLQEARLTAPVPVNLDRFGSAVAIDGDTIVVGAPQSNGACQVQGFAHVYERDAKAQWQVATTLFVPSPTPGEQFGTGVTVEGSTIAVGALSGPVRVFENSGGSWTPRGELAFDRDAPLRSNQFGQDVSLRDGFLAALSKNVTWNGIGLGGAIHVFARDSTGRFVSHASLVPSPLVAVFSFAFDGEQILTGVSSEDYLFLVPDCNRNGVPDECDLGAGIGDANGNGIPDVCEAESRRGWPLSLRKPWPSPAREARTGG